MKKNFGSLTAGDKGDLYLKNQFSWYFSYPSCQIRGESTYSWGCLPIKRIMYGGEKLKHWQFVLPCYQNIRVSANPQLHWKAISIEVLIWPHLCEICMLCKMDPKGILRDNLPDHFPSVLSQKLDESFLLQCRKRHQPDSDPPWTYSRNKLLAASPANSRLPPQEWKGREK